MSNGLLSCAGSAPISPPRPLRILQVVGGMDRRGTETWLMHVLRHIDRDRFRMDFLVHGPQRYGYEDEIAAVGSRVIRCLHPKRPWTYAANFRRVLRETGPYDIVHSHVHHFTGLVLRLAAAGGVPVRIAHSHSDTSGIQQSAGWMRRCYLRWMRRWIRENATVGLAASCKAAAALFGADWQSEPNCRVLHCGIDLTPFGELPDRTGARDELGLPRDSFVVGHVGSFSPPKNHEFFVEIARHLAARVSNVRFLLVGDGPLRSSIEEQVARAGLADRFVFVGVRHDVPRMLGAMDAFLFPSRWEGMPLSVVEAQAAGLPCFVADTVTTETRVVRPLVAFLSLRQPAAAWADAISESRQSDRGIGQADALAILRQSSFDILSSTRDLESVYGGP